MLQHLLDLKLLDIIIYIGDISNLRYEPCYECCFKVLVACSLTENCTNKQASKHTRPQSILLASVGYVCSGSPQFGVVLYKIV